MNKFLLAVIMSVTSSLAQGESIVEEDEVRDRARNRLYLGGIDEEDLEVQARLVTPVKKISTKSIQAEVFKVKPKLEDSSGEE